MKSPFYLKVIPTNAPFFCDRKEELKSLIFHAENSMNVVLYSPRRFGKTSLIKKMQAKLQNHDIESVYIDLSGVLDVDAVCKNIASGIYTYAKKEKSLIKRVTKFFQNLRPVFIPDPTTGDIKVDFRPIVPKTGIDLLEEVFDSFDNMIKKSGAKFNIAIDEFQEITTIKQGAQIEAFLRQKIQHQENISYIFSGSQRRILTDIFNQKKRPFYKSSINMKLPPLPEKDAINSIIAQFKNGKKRCSNEIAEQIIKTVNCYPYYIQKLCYTIFEISLKNDITEQDFETGYLKMIDQESSYFQGMENKLAHGQQQLLNALAIEPVKEIFATEYTKKHNLKSTRSISTAREKLLNLDYIEQDKNFNFKLTDPIFAAWLNKKNAFIPYNAEVFIEDENPIKTIKEEQVQEKFNLGIAEIPEYATKEFIQQKGIEITADIETDKKEDNRKPIDIFISYARDDKLVKQDFLGRIKKRLNTNDLKYRFIFSADTDILPGQDWHEEIQKSINQCDYGLLLISTNFLNSKYIEENELPELLDKCIPVALDIIDIGENGQNLKGLKQKQIFFYDDNKAFTECGKNNKIRFINSLAKKITEKIKKHEQKQKKIKEKLTCPYKDGISHLYKEKEFIPDQQAITEFIGDKERKTSPEKINVADYLMNWVINSDVPFFALLGDYGTGKTFNSRMLARKINKLYNEQPDKYPLCIYVDLRFVESKQEKIKVPKLKEILQSAINKTQDVLDESIVTSKDIIKLVRTGKAMIIFDGLDEKTVNFSIEETNNFIRNLWSIRKEDKEPIDNIDKKEEQSQGKVLISCRTHYFKDIKEQNSFLLGHDREGKKSANYLACSLLLFDEKQIKEYLKIRLKLQENEINKIILLLESVHNLKDLAKRPYTLSLITEFIPDIEDLKEKGEKVNTAKLYEKMIDRWLGRDIGKHKFVIEHKKRLMQTLAINLFKLKEQSLKTNELGDWLDKWLYENPITSDAYKNIDRETLKKDLRTATFIIRESDKDFGFAHTSLQEYFLSSYIVEQFEKTKDEIKQNLAIDIPSKETIDFIIQIFELEQDKLDKAIEKIEKIMERQYVPKVSELFLKLWLKFKEHDLSCPNPIEIHLENADLEKWEIKNINLSKAFLNNANLKHAEFKNMDLIDCDFTDANLDSAVILNCNLENSNFKNTDGNGIIFKNSNLTYTEWKGANLYFANFVKCDLENSKNLNKNQKIYFVKSSPFKTKKIKNFELACLIGHAGGMGLGGITSCTFSSCGQFVVSGSKDRTIKLWDVKTGKEIREFTGHKNSVESVSFSPCGQFIVSGSSDRTIKLWDVKTGKEIREFTGHEFSVISVSFSFCGQFIVSGSSDRTIKLWDVKTGKEIQEFTGHKGSVNSVSFSSCGQFIVSGSSDRTIKLWDVKTGKALQEFTGYKAHVFSVSFSPCGQFIVSGSDDSTIKLWDVKTGKELREFTGHKGSVLSVSFSSYGQFIVSGSIDRTIKLWDVKTGKEVEEFTRHKGPVWSVSFSSCGQFIVSGSFYGTIKLWDVKTGIEIRELKGDGNWIDIIGFSKDGTKVFSKDIINTTRAWDIKTGKSNAIDKDFKNLCYPKNQNIRVTAKKITIKNRKYCFLPDNTLAVIDIDKNKVLTASKNSWKWLGVIPKSGFDRYPIEILEEWE